MKPGNAALVEGITLLLRHRRSIVILSLFGGLFAISLALTADRRYRAAASFVPHAAESSVGGAAALARRFGVNVGGAGRNTYSPEFYAHLARSRQVLSDAVQSSYAVPVRGRDRTATLIEIYGIEAATRAETVRDAVQELRGNTSVSVDLETGVVEVAVSAMTPDLAEAISARILELLRDFNRRDRHSQAMAEVQFIAERLEEAGARLRTAEEALQRFYDSNRQFQTSPELMFEHQRLQRQVSMSQALYTNLAESHENARIEAAKDLPVLTVVNQPQGSALPLGRGTVKRGILGALLGFIVAMGLAFTRSYANNLSSEESPAMAELRSVMSEVWADVRWPQRLLRLRAKL